MIQKELYALLESTGYPVVYHSFVASNLDAEIPPYIVYFFTDSDNISADNKVAVRRNNYRVELYTDKKDLLAESTLETVLDNASFFYNKQEVYIDTESMFQIIYEVEI